LVELVDVTWMEEEATYELINPADLFSVFIDWCELQIPSLHVIFIGSSIKHDLGS